MSYLLWIHENTGVSPTPHQWILPDTVGLGATENDPVSPSNRIHMEQTYVSVNSGRRAIVLESLCRLQDIPTVIRA